MLVLELVEGRDLSHFLYMAKDSGLSRSERDCLEIMRQVANALFYLHTEKGIVHRDLKPANILIMEMTVRAMTTVTVQIGGANIAPGDREATIPTLPLETEVVPSQQAETVRDHATVTVELDQVEVTGEPGIMAPTSIPDNHAHHTPVTIPITSPPLNPPSTSQHTTYASTPSNPLPSTPPQRYQAKLADFGIAKMIGTNLTATLCGTPAYLSPELHRGEAHGFPADIWAFGCILYQLLSGDSGPPFGEKGSLENIEKMLRDGGIFAGEKWRGVSSLAKDLIRGCLAFDVSERMRIEEVLGHEWFSA